jgi:hypothetical protein
MNSFLRGLFLIYFVTHIPITILVDAQALFGDVYPAPLQNVMAWYIGTYGDFLMDQKPDWLKSMIICEVFLQLPFFFVATFALAYKKAWIRIPMIVYG